MPTDADLEGWTELKTIRRLDGSSLKQLSLLSGIAKGHLSDLENGKRRPTAGIIAKLATALDVPSSVLEPRAAPLPASVIEAVAKEGRNGGQAVA